MEARDPLVQLDKQDQLVQPQRDLQDQLVLRDQQDQKRRDFITHLLC